ncbi:MAG: hypothetical protein ACLRMJ_12545 [Alistipes finegoldii]
MSDNFSGIASCTLLIDGRWVPCDRFPMQGTLVHAFDLPAAKTPQRAAHGDGQMRQYSPLGGNILAVNS